MVILSKTIPIINLKNASKVLPFKKNNCLSTKKPKVPTPPRVICTVLKRIKKEPYQDRATLFNENLALIGSGQGCSGLILFTREDESLKVFRSGEPIIRKNKRNDKTSVNNGSLKKYTNMKLNVCHKNIVYICEFKKETIYQRVLLFIASSNRFLNIKTREIKPTPLKSIKIVGGSSFVINDNLKLLTEVVAKVSKLSMYKVR
tara:strand:+ start:252 stop:860 length:609 start_codon:yes stop_codon:yes gene_type:complete